MKLFAGKTEFHIEERTAVAIGKFDGMHLGHRFLISELVRLAHTSQEEALKTVVFTFDPSPASFFSGETIPELFTKEEKREVFSALHVDYLIEFPMNAETAAIPAETFVEQVLVDALHAGFVIAGGDLSFGHQGAGNFALLEEKSAQYGFSTSRIEKVMYDGAPISSSRIRKAIRAGNMEEANTMLDVPYSFSGEVAHGTHIGHTLGFPTINLLPPAGKLLPPNGVYLSNCFFEDAEDTPVPGITNLGVKPTVSGENKLGAETFLYDTSGDFYGKNVRIELLSFRRAEKKFESVEALKARLQRDIEEGKRLHGLP